MIILKENGIRKNPDIEHTLTNMIRSMRSGESAADSRSLTIEGNLWPNVYAVQ